MILPTIRDSRFITIRRGGTLTDARHYLLALWAAQCAEHVLLCFEKECPDDFRPRKAIELARSWACGEITVTEPKVGAYHANAAARDAKDALGPAARDAARFAALSAGQAAAVAHVAAHELGAAAYAIRAAMAVGGDTDADGDANSAKRERGFKECAWQQEQLPDEIRELVLDDQKNRNDICWRVFLHWDSRRSYRVEDEQLV